eukprot:TRINITY_DN2418_c1_g1_i2.p1 TRINITY_DN2418_c1_g1~~TRINITY_DN2418_c1_g1_i2.p1  ORF type:complete len:744 (+),score=134.96 TRINITY_DN2418_c1_g1_i2:245-2233(+)
MGMGVTTTDVPPAEVKPELDKEERRRSWLELRQLVRQIYAEVRIDAPLDDGLSISFEKTYNIVYRLCKYDAEKLFRKLEKEAINYLECVREGLITQLSTQSMTNRDAALKFLELLTRKYDDLCAANDIFNGVFIYLHNCFMKQFRINFGDINKGLFWEIVYQDPILQTNIPRLKNLLGRSESALQQYVALEKKLRETRNKWKKLKKQLDQYEMEKVREVRLREECQQLQQRWHKVDEHATATITSQGLPSGSVSVSATVTTTINQPTTTTPATTTLTTTFPAISDQAHVLPAVDLDSNAIADHIHSCPFCFHHRHHQQQQQSTTASGSVPQQLKAVSSIITGAAVTSVNSDKSTLVVSKKRKKGNSKNRALSLSPPPHPSTLKISTIEITSTGPSLLQQQQHPQQQHITCIAQPAATCCTNLSLPPPHQPPSQQTGDLSSQCSHIAAVVPASATCPHNHEYPHQHVHTQQLAPKQHTHTHVCPHVKAAHHNHVHNATHTNNPHAHHPHHAHCPHHAALASLRPGEILSHSCGRSGTVVVEGESIDTENGSHCSHNHGAISSNHINGGCSHTITATTTTTPTTSASVPRCASGGRGHCCVHSHFLYCDHMADSAREKLQEKLRTKLSARSRSMLCVNVCVRRQETERKTRNRNKEIAPHTVKR